MKIKMKISNICYYTIVFILFFTTYISLIYRKEIGAHNLVASIKNINIIFLLLVSMILVFLKLQNKQVLKKDIKVILLLIIFSIFLKKLYLCFFIVIISSFINKQIRLKCTFFIFTFFYVFILILNNLGCLEFNNIDYGRRIFGENEIIRYALGFAHPNTAMSLLIPIFSLLYYLYYPKYKKIVLGIILIVGKIIFDLTFSRTTFLLIILFVILILIKDKYIKKLKILFLIEGFFITFITFYLPPRYNQSDILLKINGLVSGRFWFFNQYFIREKISFFGNSGMEKIYLSLPLDNMYLRILYENGIVGLSILVFLIFITMYILFKNQDYKAVRIFSIILIFGFMESMGYYYYYCIIYFIISDYIFRKEKNE